MARVVYGGVELSSSAWGYFAGDVRDSPRLVLRPQLSLKTKIRHISAGGDSIYHG